MLIVTGSFRLPQERIEAARQPIRAVIETTRREEGNVVYAYAQDVLDPTLFRITEIWRDRSASERHLTAAHLGAFLGAMMELGVSDIELTEHIVTSSVQLSLG